MPPIKKSTQSRRKFRPSGEFTRYLTKNTAQAKVQHVSFCSTCGKVLRAKKSGRKKIALHSVREFILGWLAAAVEFAVSNRFSQPIGALELTIVLPRPLRNRSTQGFDPVSRQCLSPFPRLPLSVPAPQGS